MPSDLRFKFEGDASKLEAELDKLERRYAQLKEQMKRIQQEEGTYSTGLEKTLAGLTRKATAFLSVGAAAGAVTAAYREHVRLLEEISQKADEAAKRQVQIFAASGDLARLGEVAPEAREAFGAVSAAGANLGFSRRAALARELAKLAPLQQDVQQQGGLAAALAEMFPGTKPGDIADLLVSVQAQAKGQAGAIAGGPSKLAVQALGRAGMAPEQALAFALEGLTQDLPEKLIEKLGVAVSDRGLEPIAGRGRPLTAEEQLFNRYVAAAPTERLRLIQSEPLLQRRLLGEVATDRLKNLDANRIADRERQLREAQTKDLAQAQLRELSKTREGTKVLLSEQLERDKKQAEAELARGQDVPALVRGQFNVDQLRRGMLGRAVARMIFETGQFGLRMADPFGTLTPGERALWAQEAAGGAPLDVARRVGAARRGLPLEQYNPGIDELRQILEELRRGNAINAAAANRQPAGVGPNLHGEGAQGLTQ